jgi:CHAT domain-containing protein
MLSVPEATEINVREHIRNRRFIHFAAHGLVDDRHGNLFGAIALTPPRDGSQSSENDGFLSLYEIYSLPLKECELVALSACQTNVGTDRPLEAGCSLARAFLTAGARSVVSCHWSVDDDSTAMLVSRLFQYISEELKQGRSGDYAEALKKARRDVRRVSRWESPYYWAPFVLTGATN